MGNFFLWNPIHHESYVRVLSSYLDIEEEMATSLRYPGNAEDILGCSIRHGGEGKFVHELYLSSEHSFCYQMNRKCKKINFTDFSDEMTAVKEATRTTRTKSNG
jgi:hypothetical protein